MKKWVYNTLIVFFAVVFLGSAGYIGYYLYNSRQEAGRYEELAQLVEMPTRPAIREEEQLEGSAPTEPTTSPELLVEVTDRKGNTVVVMQQFAELFQMNNDMVGWLSIPGTDIDYPVMQTPSKPDYYLRRNFDKKHATQGCLYARETCDVFTPGDNVTIYGHRMRDRTMFGQLDKYMDKAFFEEQPYIYFDNLRQMHTYKVMAVFLTTASVGKGFSYHTFEEAETEADFRFWVDKCKELSLYDTGVEAEFGDKFITLSTCDKSITNGRLVVVAKMVG